MSIQEILETIRAAPEPPNEEAAKFKVIAPILDGLGWSPWGSDVEFEQSVGSGKGAGRIDIALKGRQRLVALIEAKSPGVRLNDHVAQLLGYAFHEGVDICALTTGLEWWFYLPREQGRPEKRRFAVLKVLEGSADRLAQDFEDFLGRNALLSGAALKRAQNVLEAEHRRALLSEQIPNIWRKMVNEADEELVEALTSRVYEKVNLRPDREQVIAVIRSGPVAGSVTTQTPDTPLHTQAAAISKRPRKAPSRKPTGILIFGQRYEISTYRQGFCELVALLYQRHPIELMELRTSSGRPYISDSPEGLLTPFEVGPGYWINTHDSSEGLIRRGKALLQGLGYKAEDFEFVFD